MLLYIRILHNCIPAHFIYLLYQILLYQILIYLFCSFISFVTMNQLRSTSNTILTIRVILRKVGEF